MAAAQAVGVALVLREDSARRPVRGGEDRSATGRSSCSSEHEWPVVKKHGLDCAMANGFGQIPVGFNRPDNHDKLVADAERMIPLAAAAGVPNIVVLQRQPRRPVRRRGHRQLRHRPQARRARRRAARRHALPRAAQQQGRPQGLQARPHGVGRRGRARRRLAALQAALRHLPHADHGRRRDPHDSRTTRSTSPTTTPAASPAGTRSTTRRS